jgi:hypothetical protein
MITMVSNGKKKVFIFYDKILHLTPFVIPLAMF